MTYPKSLVCFFVDRARNLLDIELDFPSVATVQAMMALSCHQVGNANKTRGWLYSGMSMRLAFDLALHLDLSNDVMDGTITSAEAEVRRMVFWSSYTADQTLGFQLGRPVRIDMDDVTVRKPDGPSLHEGTTLGNTLIQNASSLQVEASNVAEHVRQQRVALCDIMAPCGYILYGTTRYTKDTLRELNVNIVTQLSDWKAKLPLATQIDLDETRSDYASSVLILHMQYHQSMIYTHRPWMSKHGIQPQPPRNPGYRHARGMCVHSAIAIAKILLLHESQRPLKYIHHSAVHITSSAALLLLFADVCSCPDWKKEDVIACLSTCFRALDEFSASWQSARQAMDSLLGIQQKWHSRKDSAPASRQAQMGPGAAISSLEFEGNNFQTSLDNALFSMHNDDSDQFNMMFDADLDWSLLPADSMSLPAWNEDFIPEQTGHQPG